LLRLKCRRAMMCSVNLKRRARENIEHPPPEKAIEAIVL
jgi:hypothetical protein